MTPAEGATGYAKFIEALKDLPMWLCSALAVAAGILLFVPSVNSELPSSWRPWLVVTVVVFGVIAAFKFVSAGVDSWRASLAKAKARRTFHATPLPQRSHWSANKQADGSIVTQISAVFAIKNQSAAPLGLVGVRVLEPKIRGEILTSMVSVQQPRGRMDGTAVSSDYRIASGRALPADVLMMIRGSPRCEADQDLYVTFGISDEDGNEQRVKVVCKGLQKPKLKDKPIPLEALHQVSDPIEKDVAAVLQAELGRYVKNGRDGGGFGSVYLVYRGQSLHSFGGDSWTPNSPSNQEIKEDPEHATLHSDSLDAMQAIYVRLNTDDERLRYVKALLSRLDESKGYARVTYLIVCRLWQMDMLQEALEAAKFGLQANDRNSHSLSNMLMMFNGLLRYRHPDFADKALDALEVFLQGSEEHPFQIPQKIAATRAWRLANKV